ncbi:DsbA family oxidoreductase [Reinekea sp.]|jgi:predicted DsbA family dithiol-disulfide isomerase|uniref:DsbA family oxidoreductase n=1 Tax=Reinekea sp. TaxID=1970455 RepID=UPI002A81A118|nr:DsbA family oxidoreductase [Reinekea sp.]
MKIEIVSDPMCPWCVIGYKNLSQALTELAPELRAEISWQPFELNPHMPLAGQNLREHLVEKYGMSTEQSDSNREHIRELGTKAGFSFNFADDGIMINSFDCHRLLAWAQEQGKQNALQMALFTAHFSDNQRLNDRETLLEIVNQVGLDRTRGEEILAGDDYRDWVRSEQQRLHQLGISSVPTFIINDQYSISGGQPADVFRQALQQIQAETVGA